MANHVRRQIREAIASAVTGLATTGPFVFQSRVYPAQTSEMPCLLVFTTSESVEVSTIHPSPMLQRTLQMQIVALARATVDLDDTLDQICKEVETILANPLSILNSLARSIKFLGTEIEMQGTAEKPIGAATLSYEIEYFTLESAPDVAH